ncbi:MAG: flagellar hook assembly protein FlgD [Gammaproteobacteria bacterium]|nr:flagellar hook assembly protein FlgD [Gammaproteobacteria bacterium]MCF6230670.1 flagellar hook assembly protein FlgD [Gammaproteobacteria bacterium]
MENITSSSAYLESLGLGATPKSEEAPSKSDEFLTLMLAQIENQDPLEPMDNGEFLTQLAQIEAAGGIADLQVSFDSMANTLQSSQALQASSMVGRNVVVPSDTSSLRNGNLSGAVGLADAAERVDVKIYNESGSLVRTLDLGALSGGISSFSWDGKDAEGNVLPDGQYEIKSTAWYSSGVTEQLPTMANATVESVTIGSGSQGIALNLDGLGSWRMADVLQIHQ